MNGGEKFFGPSVSEYTGTAEVFMQTLFTRLGATFAQVTPAGVATRWPSKQLAETCKAKLVEMGLCHVELFPDNGQYAVFAMFTNGRNN